jgi:23S rRNA C2498 (ribose-2'-O)-methylase RlmM
MKRSIENYDSIKPIVCYLDNENLLKTNLNVKAPHQNVSKDIAEFNEKFIKITEMYGILETNFKDKELLKILDKISDLASFQKYLGKVKYLQHLEEAN